MRLLFALLLVLWSGHGKAANPESWSVRVDVQMIAIDPKQAVTLLPELQRGETADAAIEKIQSMIANDKAELLGWPSATAATGQRATSQGGEDLRYPDYWSLLPSGRGDSGWAPPAIATYRLTNHLGQHWGQQTPTDFETRTLGPTMEFKAVVSETGSSIALRVAIEAVEFWKFHEYCGTPSPTRIAGTIVVPEVRRRSYSSDATVQHGKRILLTSYVEQRPQPRVILYLLRARALGDPAPSK